MPRHQWGVLGRSVLRYASHLLVAAQRYITLQLSTQESLEPAVGQAKCRIQQGCRATYAMLLIIVTEIRFSSPGPFPILWGSVLMHPRKRDPSSLACFSSFLILAEQHRKAKSGRAISYNADRALAHLVWWAHSVIATLCRPCVRTQINQRP